MKAFGMRNGLTTLGVALALLIGSVASPLSTARADALTPVKLNIPSNKSLEEALLTLAEQAGMKISYRSQLSANLTAPAVQQSFPNTAAALDALLAHTSLGYTFVDDTIVVFEKSVPPSALKQTSYSVEGNTRLAQLNDGPATRVNDAAQSGGQTLEEVRVNVPEVIVTGGRILNMDIPRSRNDVQPYVTFDHDTIVQSGAANLEDFFRTRLAMNTQGFSSDNVFSADAVNNSINLRGLGANQTLILVDGHRLAPSGSTPGAAFMQSAIKGIPIRSIERIEVLPTSASALYGGSATGGVINIIRRRDYSGSELQLTYDNAFEGDSANRRVDFSSGLSFAKTNLLLSGSFSDGNPLVSNERDFLLRGRQQILAHDPTFYYDTFATPVAGRTTNLRNSASGANLTFDDGTSLNASRTYVPVGYAGRSVDNGAALRDNAGRFNFDPANTASSGLQSLASNPTLASLNATVRQEFTPNLQAFVDFGLSENKSYFQYGSGDISFTLPGSAPDNPFLESVRVTVPLTGTPANEFVTQASDRRVVGGLIFKLPHAWQAEADYTWQRWYRHPFTAPPSLSATQVRLAATAGTINVLRDPNLYPIDGTAYETPPTTYTGVSTSMRDYTARFSGPVFSLPGGEVIAATLAEYRQEYLSDQRSSALFSPTTLFEQLTPSMSQSVKSVSTELRVPLFSKRNALTFVKDLELQLAGRYDGYAIDGANGLITSTNGVPDLPLTRVSNDISSTDFTLGLRYTPVNGVMLRASYGTGFLPPAVTQLLPNPTNPNADASSIIDPRRGGTPIGTTISFTNGGNPTLQPEESKSWSAGVVFTPVQNLRVSVDYTRIDKSDNILALGPQEVLDNEGALPGRVTRAASCPGDPFAPVCPITGINATLANIARTEVRAYDLQLDYNLLTAGEGRFDFFALLTYQPHLRIQLQPDSAVQETAGINALSSIPLKLKGSAGVSWSLRTLRLNWTANYFDDYLVADPNLISNASTILRQGNKGRVPSQLYHDVFASWSPQLQASRGAWLSDIELQLGVQNLFNKEPPFDFTNSGNYYSYLGNPRLRSYSLSLRKGF